MESGYFKNPESEYKSSHSDKPESESEWESGSLNLQKMESESRLKFSAAKVKVVQFCIEVVVGVTTGVGGQWFKRLF